MRATRQLKILLEFEVKSESTYAHKCELEIVNSETEIEFHNELLIMKLWNFKLFSTGIVDQNWSPCL